MKELKVLKEHYVKEGKEYSCYCVKGQIKGTNVKVQLLPPDFAGYTLLDIVFGDADTADLVVTPFEMKDSNGKVIKGNTYGVKSVDEDGEVYECKILPAKVSDKTMLNMLLNCK